MIRRVGRCARAPRVAGQAPSRRSGTPLTRPGDVSVGRRRLSLYAIYREVPRAVCLPEARRFADYIRAPRAGDFPAAMRFASGDAMTIYALAYRSSRRSGARRDCFSILTRVDAHGLSMSMPLPDDRGRLPHSRRASRRVVYGPTRFTRVLIYHFRSVEFPRGETR